MPTPVSDVDEPIRQLFRKRAGRRCEYCRLPQRRFETGHAQRT
jgi:hypothetical protein